MLICGEGGGVSGGVEVEGLSQADQRLVGRQGWRWRGNGVQIAQRAPRSVGVGIWLDGRKRQTVATALAAKTGWERSVGTRDGPLHLASHRHTATTFFARSICAGVAVARRTTRPSRGSW